MADSGRSGEAPHSPASAPLHGPCEPGSAAGNAARFLGEKLRHVEVRFALGARVRVLDVQHVVRALALLLEVLPAHGEPEHLEELVLLLDLIDHPWRLKAPAVPAV